LNPQNNFKADQMAEVSALARSLWRTMSMDGEDEEDENLEPIVGNPELEGMVRQVFSMPKEEKLVKDFPCSFIQGDKTVFGKFCIAEEHLIFFVDIHKPLVSHLQVEKHGVSKCARI
jgi:ATP-dependent RNA circularization protein (DNA/RNA ligase family)